MGLERENIPGITFDRPWKWLLIPGFLFQWFLYMFPTGNYGAIVSITRQSRSAIMTYVFSFIFWALLLGFLSSLLTPSN